MEYHSLGGFKKHQADINADFEANIPQLLNKFIPDIHRFLKRRGLFEYADDITQEAYLILLEKNQQQPISNLEGYLFGTIRNICIERFKAKKRNREDFLPPEEMEEMAEQCHHTFVQNLAFDQEMTENSKLNYQDLIKLMEDKLKEEQQKILQMKFFQGWSYTEISQYLNKPEPTVRKTVSRALEKLRP